VVKNCLGYKLYNRGGTKMIGILMSMGLNCVVLGIFMKCGIALDTIDIAVFTLGWASIGVGINFWIDK